MPISSNIESSHDSAAMLILSIRRVGRPKITDFIVLAKNTQEKPAINNRRRTGRASLINIIVLLHSHRVTNRLRVILLLPSITDACSYASGIVGTQIIGLVAMRDQHGPIFREPARHALIRPAQTWPVFVTKVRSRGCGPFQTSLVRVHPNLRK